MGKLPVFLEKYFWDVDFRKVDPEKSRAYILRRILEYGDQRAVTWMWRKFEKSEIKDTVSRYRGYSQKSANFWALILGIPKGKVSCLRQRSSKAPKRIWPY